MLVLEVHIFFYSISSKCTYRMMISLKIKTELLTINVIECCVTFIVHCIWTFSARPVAINLIAGRVHQYNTLNDFYCDIFYFFKNSNF